MFLELPLIEIAMEGQITWSFVCVFSCSSIITQEETSAGDYYYHYKHIIRKNYFYTESIDNSQIHCQLRVLQAEEAHRVLGVAFSNRRSFIDAGELCGVGATLGGGGGDLVAYPLLSVVVFIKSLLQLSAVPNKEHMRYSEELRSALLIAPVKIIQEGKLHYKSGNPVGLWDIYVKIHIVRGFNLCVKFFVTLD